MLPNMFKPIKESSEENDSSSKSGGGNSRTQSDSEVSVRSPSFKMSKLNRLSPKCSTPAESDQEGVFVISRPLNVAGTRRSNSVGEQDTKCASMNHAYLNLIGFTVNRNLIGFTVNRTLFRVSQSFFAFLSSLRTFRFKAEWNRHFQSRAE